MNVFRLYMIVLTVVVTSSELIGNLPYYSPSLGLFSELVCNTASEMDIFTCRVIENYRIDKGIVHVAVIEERFRGAPADTISFMLELQMGWDLTNQVHYKLVPDSRHLLIAQQQKNGHYLTRYGKAGFSGILNVKLREDYRDIEARSKAYLATLRTFAQLQSSLYTGPVTLRQPSLFKAKGKFKNGKPEGKWVHVDLSKKRKDRYAIVAHYKNGQLHGDRYIDLPSQEPHSTKSIEYYEQGKNKSYTSYHPEGNKVQSVYHVHETDSIRYETQYAYDENGELIHRSQTIRPLHSFVHLRCLHGTYINLPSLDNYTYRDPLAEGQYDRGAKIGKWIYYDDTGKIDTIISYPSPTPSQYNFVLYHSEGAIAFEGDTIAGTRQGLWTSYTNEGALENQMSFTNGHFSGTYIKNRWEISLYKDSKLHGAKQRYDDNKKLESVTQYVAGVKQGAYLSYYPSGQLKSSSTYEKGTLVDEEKHYSQGGTLLYTLVRDKRGAKTGYHRNYDAENRITDEGHYLKGYKSGEWLVYKWEGEKEIINYPITIDELMSYSPSPIENAKIMPYDPEVHGK